MRTCSSKKRDCTSMRLWRAWGVRFTCTTRMARFTLSSFMCWAYVCAHPHPPPRQHSSYIPPLSFDWFTTLALTLTIFDNIILEKSDGSKGGVYVNFYRSFNPPECLSPCDVVHDKIECAAMSLIRNFEWTEACSRLLLLLTWENLVVICYRRARKQRNAEI